jgi:ABC-2 type transport system permease protein
MMLAAWRAEIAKVLTVRGQRIGLLVAVIVTPLTSLLVVSTGGLSADDTVTSGAATGSVLGLLAWGIWAASSAASEYSYGTMTVSLAAVPRRTVLFGAKIAGFGALAAGGALVSAVASWVLVRSVTPAGGHHSGNAAALLALVAAAATVAAVGAAGGVLSRSSTASLSIVVAAVLLPKAAAGLLGGLQPWVVGASPGTVITQAVNGAQLASDQTYPGGTWLALVSMVAVAAVVAVGSGAAFVRRDG